MKNAFRSLFIGSIFVLFFTTRAVASSDRLIIIDDDIGMNRDGVWKTGSYWFPWLKITDPDGGLELIYALRDPSVTVLGITTMMGAAPTDVAFAGAQNILKTLDRSDIPVFKGAQTPADLGKETQAARFIVDMARKYPGKVEIIATGPLTNIATAMMMEPQLPKLWRSLHFVTGEFYGALGERSEWYAWSLVGLSDLNMNTDVRATEYVLEHGGPFPIYPNELMDEVMFSRADFNKLSGFVARELAPLTFLSRFFKIPVHGAVPVAVILDPTLGCKVTEKAVVMKNYGYRGYAFGLSDDTELPKHTICFGLDNTTRAKIHDSLLQRLKE